LSLFSIGVYILLKSLIFWVLGGGLSIYHMMIFFFNIISINQETKISNLFIPSKIIIAFQTNDFSYIMLTKVYVEQNAFEQA
jgi:hypothetical protein